MKSNFPEFIKRLFLHQQRDLLKSEDPMLIAGIDFTVKVQKIDGKNIKFQFWVLSEGDRFRFLIPTYVKGSKGCIFMYDVANYSTLTQLNDCLTIIKENFDTIFPIIVVGNKATSEKREVSEKDALNFTKTRNLDAYIECNTTTGENVEAVFETLTRLILQKFKP